MRDPFQSGRRKWRFRRLMELDSWIDSTLWESGQDVAETYERIVIFMRRFRVGGVARALNEAASEALTLSVAGAMLALSLAIPAFEEIGSDWRNQSEFSVTFLDRYGNEIGRRGILQDASVELEELPDHLVKAVLATEDRRFFTHFGIDVIGTFRALVENARAGVVVQGGSSITQQVAKNLFLSNERTLQRKIKEAYLALWLEANLSKREILKLYFDRSYMGGGTFGLAAASEFYFGKPVAEIDLSEAAIMAGLFKAPARYAPHINLPAARARANEVLSNMVQAGFMTEGQVIAARRDPARVVEREKSRSPDYFLDWAFEQTKQMVDGRERVLVVQASLDPRLQEAAEAAVESSLRESGGTYNVRQAALVAMEPDGTVRAMVGGRDYGDSTFNRATNALRQPGSSFKAYVYAAAFEHGFSPESVVLDGPVSIGNWSPGNYSNRYHGRVSLLTAFTHSYNTVPVRLSISMGRQPIADMAARLGIATPIRVTRSLPLGPSEVTVLDQATGFSAFASGGLRAEPTGVLRITTPSGDVLYDRIANPPERKRVLDQRLAQDMVKMMHNVVENGTGRRARIPGVPAAGKTGTTQAYRDAWFVGFTGSYTAAVWFGNDNFSKTARLTGGRLPAETWQKFMRLAHVNAPVKPLPGIPLPAEPPPETPVAGADGEVDPSLVAATQRLSPASLEAIQRLQRRFRRDVSSRGEPVREAALRGEPDPAEAPPAQ
jgi:penicillin-binding protein 1A